MASSRKPQLEWSAVAEDFEPDGALRDVYVQHATLADWQVVIEHVRAEYASVKFTVDGQPTELPPSVAAIFSIREQASPLLNFDIGGISINCHFFDPSEIEFDLRPEEVTGADRLAAVVAFLRGLVTAVRKPAILTCENVREAVLLRADPLDGAVVLVPPPEPPAV